MTTYFENTYYNFLPPKDQYYTGGLTQISNDIGNINFLDSYLPQYQITTGDIVPLYTTTGNSNGTPINIQGVTGPTGSTGGTTGDPPQATTFLMVSYAQLIDSVTNISGNVQFSLMDSNPILGNKSYSFASVNNLMNYNNTTLLYYTVDNSSPPNIQFYDAKLVQQNPTQPIKNYQLYSITYGEYSGNANTFASWPYNNTQYQSVYNDYDNNNYAWAKGLNYEQGYYVREPFQMNTFFQFNEFVGLTGSVNWDSNSALLKSGKMYHPSYIQMYYADGTTSNDNGYTQYSSGAYNITGYSFGYPININYTYTSITTQNVPNIINLNDNTPNRYEITWPQNFSLNEYSFNTNNNPSFNIDFENTLWNINNIADNNFLGCSCSSNNDCENFGSIFGYSYWGNNCSTIQAGIAQYMVYQFIPVSQIKTPPSNIITNYTNTDYSYTTLPQGSEFTPSQLLNPLSFYGATGSTGATGSFPLQIQSLYDNNTGNTGIANPNIISQWMINPQSEDYICSGFNEGYVSYCGYNNYYDSLMGISYEYGTCGGVTGPNTNPFQKGPCQDPNQICVPNFIYLKTYDAITDPPFKCVDKNLGVTYANLSNYSIGIPSANINNNKINYPQYEPTPLANTTPNFGFKKKSEKNNTFLIIAIIIAIIIVIFVIYAIYKSSTKPKSFNIYK
jgi:hypothetical protein